MEPVSGTTTLPRVCLYLSAAILLLCGARGKQSVREELVARQQKTGLTLLYFGHDTIYATSFSKYGQGYRRLVKHDPRIFEGSRYRETDPVWILAGFSFSPDGQYIAATYRIEPKNRHPYDYASIEYFFALLRFDGTLLWKVSALKASRYYCWAGDGTTLMLVGSSASDRVYGAPDALFYQLNIKSGEVRSVGRPPDYRTSLWWAPDCRHLAFTPEDSEEVRIFDIADSSSRTLGKGRSLNWSPDGRWIAYEAGKGEIWLTDPEGKAKKLFFKDKKFLSGVVWSPDSRFVVYLSEFRFGEDMRSLFDWNLDCMEEKRLRVRRVEDGRELAVGRQCKGDIQVHDEWVDNLDLTRWERYSWK